MQIVPLNETYLKEATELLKKVFNPSKEEKLTLKASLYPQKYKDYLKKHQFIELNYYVLVENEKVIGLTGLYAYDDNSYWLGWFCVDEKYRNKGYGKKLLDFSIYKAQKRKFLYLYTENFDEFKKAINLYERYGFELFNKEHQYLYYRLDFSKTNIKTINQLDSKFKDIFNFDELNEIVEKAWVVLENFIFISTDKYDFEITDEWDDELKIYCHYKNDDENTDVLDKKTFLGKLKNSKIISGNIIYVD